MNWKLFWNNNAQKLTSHAQVLRKESDNIGRMAAHICQILNISANDKVLDVCCGNGLLTNIIVQNCKQITGIDFSEKLIVEALKNKNNKAAFMLGNATQISALNIGKFDKIYLEFSFQYFSKNEGKKAIEEMLKSLNPKGKILIGDIPDRQKIWIFYNTIPKKFFYLLKLLKGGNRMGNFWRKEELDDICKSLNVKGSYLKQPNDLPYSHYRFDYLIEN